MCKFLGLFSLASQICSPAWGVIISQLLNFSREGTWGADTTQISVPKATAELRGADRVDTIAYADNGIEIVELSLKCLVTTLLSQSNSIPIAFWVHQTVLSL